MPLFAAFLSSLLGGLAGFFAEIVTRKGITIAFAVTGIAVASAMLLTAFNLAVSPLVQAMFSTQYGQFIGLAFPPMAGNCLALIGAMWAGCAAYKLKVNAIKMTASA